MRSKTKLKLLLILSVFVIVALFLFYRYPNFGKENWSIRIILIVLIGGFLIYAVRKGTFVRTLKRVLKETAEKIGLNIIRPTGEEKLVMPLECFMILKGQHKGLSFEIKPFKSITGPLGNRVASLLFWGYFDLYIETGPFQIDHSHPKIKKEGKKQIILLPEELKQMSYDFHNDAILVLPDKLSMMMKYKCPRSSDDLIKILNILADVANDIKA